MKHASPPLHGQRGVALIMAILMVALATILAVGIATEGYMDLRRTSIHTGIDSGMQLAYGAEALASEVLQRDADAKQDTLAEDWAKTPQPMPVTDDSGTPIGEIRGQLEDLQGRFNLNSVIKDDGTQDALAIKQLQRLMQLVGVSTPEKWAGMWADWVDYDSTQGFPYGAEDSTYATVTPAHLTANMPATKTSELLQLPGFTLTEFRKLEPYIAALPINTSLNVCTAPPQVLDALSTQLNRAEYSTDTSLGNVAANRQSGCWPNTNTVKNSLNGDDDFRSFLAQHPNYLGETSNYFRAKVLITLGTTELPLYSVLYRMGSGANARIQVIQRNFYVAN